MSLSTSPSSRPRTVLVLVATVVGFAVIGTAGVLRAGGGPSGGFGTGPATCLASQVASQVLPTVVTIQVTDQSGGGSNGSGQVIGSDGYILTNDHVVSPGVPGGRMAAVFDTGQSVPATIVGRAPSVDLAVVKVDPGDRRLPTIRYGVSSDLRIGQPVVALGAPLGLSGTVTSGIVSALGRDVPVPSAVGGGAILPGAVQTDAAINPGNSGGALVDCSGRLVGVNTAIATVPNASGISGGGSVGIGFAVPIDLARTVADQLIAKGSFTLPSLHLTTVPLPPQAAGRLGVSGGLYVASVSSSGPAASAGLRQGDVITSVDGRDMSGPESLFLATVSRSVGDTVSVAYLRNGAASTTTATLAAPG